MDITEYFAYGFIIVFTVLLFGYLDMLKRGGFRCGSCESELPFLRIPKSFRQCFLGGWTCKNCGTEVDKKGKVIEG